VHIALFFWDRLDRIDPAACRARVERHFTHHVMAGEYLRMFREFLATGVLPAGRTTGEDPGASP